MDNYAIEIKYINENSNNENDIDNYFIQLNIKYNNFNIYTLNTGFLLFFNKFVKEYNHEMYETMYVLEQSNGGCFIHKNNDFLTFNVSKYGSDCIVESNFTIKITTEVDKMIDNLKQFYSENINN
jgi:hypothetical protein